MVRENTGWSERQSVFGERERESARRECQEASEITGTKLKTVRTQDSRRKRETG